MATCGRPLAPRRADRPTHGIEGAQRAHPSARGHIFGLIRAHGGEGHNRPVCRGFVTVCRLFSARQKFGQPSWQGRGRRFESGAGLSKTRDLRGFFVVPPRAIFVARRTIGLYCQLLPIEQSAQASGAECSCRGTTAFHSKLGRLRPRVPLWTDRCLSVWSALYLVGSMAFAIGVSRFAGRAALSYPPTAFSAHV
jgi:hypothetical protein